MEKPLRHLAALSAVAGMLISTSVFAAPNGGNKLQCFDGTADGYPGTCSIADGTATLDNSAGPYSGVYISGTNMNGKLLSNVGNLAFDYTGTPTNGSPRLTVPVDMDGDGATDDYISVSAYFCNDGAGHVDAIHDSTCTIFRNSDGVNPVGSNWDDMVANYPTWRVSAEDLPFIIADDTGSWTVSNVRLGKAARTTGK